MDRREFLKDSALAGALLYFGGQFLIGCVDNPVKPPDDGTDDPSNGNNGRLPKFAPFHDISKSWVGKRYYAIIDVIDNGGSDVLSYSLVSSTLKDLEIRPGHGYMGTAYILRPDQVGPYKIVVDVSNDAGTVQAVLDGNENPVYMIDRYKHVFQWGIDEPDKGKTAVKNQSREHVYAALMGIPVDDVQNMPVEELDGIYQRGNAPEYKTVMENLRKLNDEELFLAFNSRSLIVEHNIVRELDDIKRWIDKDQIYYFSEKPEDLWNGGTGQAPAKHGLEQRVNQDYQRTHPVRLLIDAFGNMRR